MALCTLAAVREFLQKATGVTTDQDALVTSLIDRASVMIQNALGRELEPTNGETRTFPYQGSGMVEVGDVRTVTAVGYDSDGTAPTTLTLGDWFLRPQNSRTGVYQRVWLPNYANDARFRDRTVSITGDWGFATVPADVEHGCIVTVTTWLREASAIVVDAGVVGFERRGKVPQDVLDGLDHYRLPVV